MPHPLEEDGRPPPSNEDPDPAVTTGNEVEHLKPKRCGGRTRTWAGPWARWHRGWGRRHWGWRRRHWGWRRRHWAGVVAIGAGVVAIGAGVVGTGAGVVGTGAAVTGEVSCFRRGTIAQKKRPQLGEAEAGVLPNEVPRLGRNRHAPISRSFELRSIVRWRLFCHR